MKDETSEDESDEVSTDGVEDSDIKKWKKLILGIDDRKLLSYISDLCSARRQIGDADHSVIKKEAKPGTLKVDTYTPPPQKMAPMFHTEEDPEKLV